MLAYPIFVTSNCWSANTSSAFIAFVTFDHSAIPQNHINAFRTLYATWVKRFQNRRVKLRKKRNTWLIWPPQHHHSSGRLLPRSPGSSPSPCRSEGLVAPGGPALLLPASSPSGNTVVQGWARAEGRFIKTGPLPQYTHCFYLFFPTERKERKCPPPLFTSKNLCSPPLNLCWTTV